MYVCTLRLVMMITEVGLGWRFNKLYNQCFVAHIRSEIKTGSK